VERVAEIAARIAGARRQRHFDYGWRRSCKFRSVNPKFLVSLSQGHQNNRDVSELYGALKFKITVRL